MRTIDATMDAGSKSESNHVWLLGSHVSLPTFSMQNFWGPLLPGGFDVNVCWWSRCCEYCLINIHDYEYEWSEIGLLGPTSKIQLGLTLLWDRAPEAHFGADFYPLNLECCCLQFWLPIACVVLLDYCPRDQHMHYWHEDMLCLLDLWLFFRSI